MELVWRQYDYWAIYWRRTWKGSVVSSFLLPLLYLAAMGVGVGSLVNRHSGHAAALGGLSYLEFVAPGLLAAAALQVAVGESTYPIMGRLKWDKVFHAMSATPLRPWDITLGQLGFIAFRVATTCTVFLAVIAIFGAVSSPLAVLCAPLTVLIGLAFAAPVFALSTRLERDSGFALVFRFGVIPMFLFSGIFFPVRQLPDAIEWLAYVTPLWHGVELCRQFATGSVDWLAAIGHVAYLLLWAVVGTVLAMRGLTKRLAS